MHFTQSRIWQWVAAAVVLVAVAVGVLRKVGLPMPEVILAYTTEGRMQQLAGDLIGWQLTLRFADGRPRLSFSTEERVRNSGLSLVSTMIGRATCDPGSLTAMVLHCCFTIMAISRSL